MWPGPHITADIIQCRQDTGSESEDEEKGEQQEPWQAMYRLKLEQQQVRQGARIKKQHYWEWDVYEILAGLQQLLLFPGSGGFEAMGALPEILGKGHLLGMQPLLLVEGGDCWRWLDQEHKDTPILVKVLEQLAVRRGIPCVQLDRYVPVTAGCCDAVKV